MWNLVHTAQCAFCSVRTLCRSWSTEWLDWSHTAVYTLYTLHNAHSAKCTLQIWSAEWLDCGQCRWQLTRQIWPEAFILTPPSPSSSSSFISIGYWCCSIPHIKHQEIPNSTQIGLSNPLIALLCKISEGGEETILLFLKKKSIFIRNHLEPV